MADEPIDALCLELEYSDFRSSFAARSHNREKFTTCGLRNYPQRGSLAPSVPNSSLSHRKSNILHRSITAVVQWFDSDFTPGGADRMRAEEDKVDWVRCIPFIVLHAGSFRTVLLENTTSAGTQPQDGVLPPSRKFSPLASR